MSATYSASSSLQDSLALSNKRGIECTMDLLYLPMNLQNAKDQGTKRQQSA